ncbi:MAG: xanthine dehydrogenase accessory protein XdhC [Pseudomonadota bacterium]
MSNRAAWQLARTAHQAGDAVVLVTVASVEGSAPREVGACMAVTQNRVAGSVGGGRLEWQAIDAARALNAAAGWTLDRIVLGADRGQCCGGRVALLFERLDGDDQAWLENTALDRGLGTLTHTADTHGRRIQWTADVSADTYKSSDTTVQLVHPVEAGSADLLLFGAGHVGQAVARQSAHLPFRLHHVDTRDAYAGPGVELITHPESVLRDARPGTLVLVMTHDHALDYRVCHAALGTPAVAWVGLIGSHSKRRRLERELRRTFGEAAAATALERLACPIGPATASRAPAEVAAVIVAETLVARDRFGPAVPQPAAPSAQAQGG